MRLLQKVRGCGSWGNHAVFFRDSFEKFWFPCVGVGEGENGCNVPTTIAIVWSGPHSDQLVVELVLIPFMHELMRSTDKVQVVQLHELKKL